VPPLKFVRHRRRYAAGRHAPPHEFAPRRAGDTSPGCHSIVLVVCHCDHSTKTTSAMCVIPHFLLPKLGRPPDNARLVPL
jgi:hypothetical protein